jgi:hypothetical protein
VEVLIEEEEEVAEVLRWTPEIKDPAKKAPEEVAVPHTLTQQIHI